MKKRKKHRDGVRDGVGKPSQEMCRRKRDESEFAGKEKELGPNRKRTGMQITLDRAEMVNLMRRGWTQGQIAEHLGLSEQQVSADWRAVLKQLSQQQSEDVKAEVAIKCEEYGLLKREAWAAWEASKRDSVKKAHKSTTNNFGEQTTQETEVKEGRGDPRYLKIVCDVLKDERELKGLDAPKELNVNGTLTWDVFSGILQQQQPPEDQIDEIEGAVMRALEDRTKRQDDRDRHREIIDVESEVVEVKQRRKETA